MKKAPSNKAKFDFNQIKKQFAKWDSNKLLLVVSIVIYLLYQYKLEIQNYNILDLSLKLVLFAFVLFAGFNKKPFIAIVIVIIMGMIFIQQSQIKKEIVLNEIPQVQQNTEESSEEIVEKYGKYGLTNWDEQNEKDKYDTTLKTRLRLAQEKQEKPEKKEQFAPLEQQPTLTDMQYMESQLQKALTTNILNKEELENVESKMITVKGLQELQNNTFSDAPDKYHAPVFVKASQNYGLSQGCSTQADCGSFK